MFKISTKTLFSIPCLHAKNMTKKKKPLKEINNGKNFDVYHGTTLVSTFYILCSALVNLFHNLLFLQLTLNNFPVTHLVFCGQIRKQSMLCKCIHSQHACKSMCNLIQFTTIFILKELKALNYSLDLLLI